MRALSVLVLTAAVAVVCLSSALEGRHKSGKVFLPNMSRYQFFNESLTWTEAHKFCQRQQSQLAMPRSEAEAAAIFQLMQDNLASRIHVGFHDLFIQGHFVTVRDQPLDRIGYRRMSSNRAASSRCGSLVDSVGLEAIDCSESLPYICQLYLPEGYQPIQGYGFYKFYGYNASKTWADAVDTCFADGAYLLVINSQLEYDALFDIFAPLIGRTVSYGGHQHFANHEFISIFDDRLNATGFDVWSTVQPNITDNLCYPTLSLFLSNSFYLRGLLLDTDFYPRPFICKRDFH